MKPRALTTKSAPAASAQATSPGLTSFPLAISRMRSCRPAASRSPLTIGNACERMKAGSKRTREERIKRAELDGFLEKQKLDKDRRETFLIPTQKLQQKIHNHLLRTLQYAMDSLSDIELK